MSQGKSALIIDDSPSIREYIHTILKDELNFNIIHSACCADEGIDILESDTEHEINWVISDWEMPGKPASEVFKYVNEKYNRSDINIILITGKSVNDARSLADDVHADDFVSKPFDPTEFVKKVKRLMGLYTRRRAIRVNPCIPCEVDIGFDNYGRYGAEIINVSESGCLVSMKYLEDRMAHVYDIGSIALTFYDGSTLKLDGQIVRVERDNDSLPQDPGVRIAFDFRKVDEASLAKLKAYINQCQLIIDSNSKFMS